MAGVKNNQLDIPYTEADRDKVASIEATEVASEAEAEAGADNSKIMSPLRVAQAIAALAPQPEAQSTFIVGSYKNESGTNLIALQPVCQNNTGGVEFIDPAVEADALATIGVAKAIINNTSYGDIVLSGLLKNVTTSFAVGDKLYVGKDGLLTNIAPDIGNNGFVADDFVVYVGKITENSVDVSKKDFLISVEIIGSL